MSTVIYQCSVPQISFTIDKIFSAIDRVFTKNFIFTGEMHPFWEVVYVKSGSVQVVEDENTYTLYEGDMICHAPNEFHRIRSSGGTTPHMHILSFSSTGELPGEIKRGVFPLNMHMRAEYEGLFSQLFTFNEYYQSKEREQEGPCASFHSIGFEGVMRLCAFLLSLSRSLREKNRLYDSPRAKEYRAVVSSMKEHLNDNLTLDDFAKMHHLSKSYITKIFESYCGEGPMKYYNKLRFLKVQELLLQNKSLKYISVEMNYSSVSYLSFAFKKATGLSASEWISRADIG